MRLLFSIAIAVLPFLTCGQVPFSLQDRAFITSTSPLRNGLAGYWRLEEASGTRFDCSKNGNHLTSNNSVGQAAGVSGYTGNAATFVSASSQSLSIADNASLSVGDSQFTIAGWVYLVSTNATGIVFAKRESGVAAGTWNLFWNASGNRFAFNVYGAGGAVAGSASANTYGAPPLNTWIFLVAKHDHIANTASIQVNNGAVDSISTTAALVDDSTLVRIGAQNATATAFLNGRVDELGIWSRTLTSGEITKLYNAGLGTHFPWVHP